MKRISLRSYPTVAIIDPTNVCNLHCPLCATGSGKSDHPKGMMDEAHFGSIIDSLGPYLYELHLYNWGEPLLNRRLPELVKYAKAHSPARIFVSSNLNTLSEEMATGLIESGVDELTVAADGISEETYQKYRVGGSFEKVLTNLKALIAKRAARAERLGAKPPLDGKDGKKLKPKIIFRFMVMKHNAHEIEKARAMAAELGVNFRKKTVRVDMGDFSEGNIFEKIEKQKEWLPDETELNRYKKHDERLGKLRVCKDLWTRTFISWDGAVTPCCNVYATGDFFAASFDPDFRKIWNGPAYKAAREIFKLGKPPEGDTPICKRCVRSGNNIWVS
ncbi:MAG: radical SAM protein [Planctomycetota bacterium]|nr:radical SAM protein [Planctomycetota bacterium]